MPSPRVASTGAPASGDEVEVQDNDRHENQEVEQAVADMESEAEEP
jgi:hypothetical protein